jgi:hypothetical protein
MALIGDASCKLQQHRDGICGFNGEGFWNCISKASVFMLEGQYTAAKGLLRMCRFLQASSHIHSPHKSLRTLNYVQYIRHISLTWTRWRKEERHRDEMQVNDAQVLHQYHFANTSPP